MPGPGVAEGGHAVGLLTAGLDVETRLLVLHRLVRADLDATDRVDDVDEAAESDLDVVVDPDAGRLLERLDQQLGSAIREGRVDLGLAVAGDVDDGVPRDRQQQRLTVAHVQQHDRVGALTARDLLAAGPEVLALLLRQTRAAVRADHEVRRAGLVVRPGATGLGVDLVDLRPGPDRDQDEEQDPDQEQREDDPQPPALVRLRLRRSRRLLLPRLLRRRGGPPGRREVRRRQWIVRLLVGPDRRWRRSGLLDHLGLVAVGHRRRAARLRNRLGRIGVASLLLAPVEPAVTVVAGRFAAATRWSFRHADQRRGRMRAVTTGTGQRVLILVTVVRLAHRSLPDRHGASRRFVTRVTDVTGEYWLFESWADDGASGSLGAPARRPGRGRR